jgi:hypothetical protein
MEEKVNLILSDVMKPAIEDIGIFLSELGFMDNHINSQKNLIRQKMLDEGRIFEIDETKVKEGLQAVDTASISLNKEGIAVVLAVGARIGKEEQLKIEYARESGENNEDFRQVESVLRLQLEFRLLKDSEGITIVDHSFWSLLMESNKVMTAWRNLRSNELKRSFQEAIKECFIEEQSFLSTLKNLNLVAISKTASSDRFSGQYGITPPIADRTLFTAILKPGEYTRPSALIDSTRGSFGIERGIKGWEEINAIYCEKADQRLRVTFFKPWEFQRAYRIEFHGELFENKEKLDQLLSTIKYETRIRGIMEPVSQFTVDMICKQVKEIAPLYEHAALSKFPRLMGPYRTGG